MIFRSPASLLRQDARTQPSFQGDRTKETTRHARPLVFIELGHSLTKAGRRWKKEKKSLPRSGAERRGLSPLPYRVRALANHRGRRAASLSGTCWVRAALSGQPGSRAAVVPAPVGRARGRLRALTFLGRRSLRPVTNSLRCVSYSSESVPKLHLLRHPNQLLHPSGRPPQTCPSALMDLKELMRLLGTVLYQTLLGDLEDQPGILSEFKTIH